MKITSQQFTDLLRLFDKLERSSGDDLHPDVSDDIDRIRRSARTVTDGFVLVGDGKEVVTALRQLHFGRLFRFREKSVLCSGFTSYGRNLLLKETVAQICQSLAASIQAHVGLPKEHFSGHILYDAQIGAYIASYVNRSSFGEKGIHLSETFIDEHAASPAKLFNILPFIIAHEIGHEFGTTRTPYQRFYENPFWSKISPPSTMLRPSIMHLVLDELQVDYRAIEILENIEFKMTGLQTASKGKKILSSVVSTSEMLLEHAENRFKYGDLKYLLLRDVESQRLLFWQLARKSALIDFLAERYPIDAPDFRRRIEVRNRRVRAFLKQINGRSTHAFEDARRFFKSFLKALAKNSSSGPASTNNDTAPPAPAGPVSNNGSSASASGGVGVTRMSDSGEAPATYDPALDPALAPRMQPGMLGFATPHIGARTTLFGPVMAVRMPVINTAFRALSL